MIKEAIQHLQEFAKPTFMSAQGREWLVHGNQKTEIRPEFDTVHVQTIEGIFGFLDYLKNPSQMMLEFINVESATEIKVIGRVTPGTAHRLLAVAEARTKQFPYGKQLSLEDFVLSVQVCFKDSHDKAELLSAVSKVVQDSRIVQEDDGITQTIEVKSGVSLKENKRINPVRRLEAFRSFPGFASPEATFLFRAHKDEKGVKFSLTDMEGDNWIGLTINALREIFIKAGHQVV